MRLMHATALVLTVPTFASAAVITRTDGGSPPSTDVVASIASLQASGPSVRFRNPGTDSDIGAVFVNGSAAAANLQAVSVRTSQNVGTQVPGSTVVFQLYQYTEGATLGSGTFAPLFETSATVPALSGTEQYLRFDVSDQNQVLAPGAQYAFFVGQATEQSNANGDYDANFRFRLNTNTSGNANATDGTFVVVRDRDYGPTRPGLADVQFQIRTNEDLVYVVQATAVPEPVGGAVVLAGVAAVGLRRSRRA